MPTRAQASPLTAECREHGAAGRSCRYGAQPRRHTLWTSPRLAHGSGVEPGKPAVTARHCCNVSTERPALPKGVLGLGPDTTRQADGGHKLPSLGALRTQWGRLSTGASCPEDALPRITDPEETSGTAGVWRFVSALPMPGDTYSIHLFNRYSRSIHYVPGTVRG